MMQLRCVGNTKSAYYTNGQFYDFQQNKDHHLGLRSHVKGGAMLSWRDRKGKDEENARRVGQSPQITHWLDKYGQIWLYYLRSYRSREVTAGPYASN